MKQGYLTLAVGHPRYLRMSINLAKSVRINDPSRPICLAVTRDLLQGDIEAEARAVFHDLHIIEAGDLEGVEYKMRCIEYSPYEKTMFVDGDVLMAKKDIDHFWAKLDGTPFTFAGKKTTAGFWRVDIESLLKALDIPYVVEGNCGVFYFEKTDAGRQVFTSMTTIFAKYKDVASTLHREGQGYSIEPIFGSACAMHGLDPFPTIMRDGSQWHFTTIKGRDFKIDVARGVCAFTKGETPVSPTFIHFPGLSLKSHSESPSDMAYAAAVAAMLDSISVNAQ